MFDDERIPSKDRNIPLGAGCMSSLIINNWRLGAGLQGAVDGVARPSFCAVLCTKRKLFQTSSKRSQSASSISLLESALFESYLEAISHLSVLEPWALGLATFQMSSRIKKALTMGHQWLN